MKKRTTEHADGVVGKVKRQTLIDRCSRVPNQIDHCVKNVRIRSYSGPYFPAFGLNTGK